MKDQNQLDSDTIVIRPQAGFQEDFLSSPADIVIGGGAAGAGKTYALLLEPLRYITTVKGFGGVIFRRTTPQIKNEGGLWDTSDDLYPLIGGAPKSSIATWEFKFGNKLKFNHLEYDTNIYDHQGAQYAFIGFDELTHFTQKQFFYLMGRNRSMCGVRPYIRATCNPDPDSWVAQFIEWWIDASTGFPIPERNGVLRYFVRDKDQLVWGDTREEVVKRCPHIFKQENLKNRDIKELVKSVTFIAGSIYENKLLLANDPAYLSNLLALDEDEQQRLLHGNWKIRTDGMSLMDYRKINDLFTNFAKPDGEKCITCDYARQGQDLTVIYTWSGFAVERIEVMTTSATTEAYAAIEKERERANVSRSRTLVDEDGVGGGVIDLSRGEYIGFHGGASALENPITREKENYENLKTQCYYRIADRVNNGEIAINLNNVIVDGVPSNTVKVRSHTYDVRQLISDQLRAIKKKNPDRDGKKQINPKEEQKNILGGMSPDFADALMMREKLELEKVELEIRSL